MPAGGVRPCECREEKARAERLAQINDRLNAIPAEFRWVDLRTLKAEPARHPHQGDVIAMMLREPERSIGLFAANGMGKTLLAYGLVRLAIETGRPFVAVNLRMLLKQYQEAQFDDGIRPAITAADLERTEERMLVFLDDIGMAKPTEFTAGELYDVLNTIYIHQRHQLVVTSHSSLEKLETHWNKAGDHWGTALVRRIEELRDIQIPEL